MQITDIFVIFFSPNKQLLLNHLHHIHQKKSIFFSKNVTFLKIWRKLKRAYLFQDVLAKRLPREAVLFYICLFRHLGDCIFI